MTKKSKKKGTGTAYEGTIIATNILEGIEDERIIPVFIDDIIAPTFLKGKFGVKINKKRTHVKQIEDIVRHIFKKPRYKKPEVGSPPTFDEKEE